MGTALLTASADEQCPGAWYRQQSRSKRTGCCCPPQGYLDRIEDGQQSAVAPVGQDDGSLDRRQTELGRTVREIAVDLHRHIIAIERYACALRVEAAARHWQVHRVGRARPAGGPGPESLLGRIQKV